MANEFIARKGLIVSGSGQITGSLNVSGGITGSLFGTGSWATNAVSASFATTASAATSITFTPLSSSYAATSSLLLGSVTSASYAATASLLLGSITSASFATTASYASTATTASYFSGSLQISGLAEFPAGISLTGSLSINSGGVTGSVFGTSSWASNAISSSYALTASYAANAGGGAGLSGGTANYIPLWTSATAQSSSNIYQTTSNVGIGTTAPNRLLSVNGNANITGSLDVTSAFTAQTKSFKIIHQRLPGKSLVYGVLEAPEHGVYVRGRLKNNTVITLPEEWDWLVDIDSVTVNLTPIGKHQKLYVDAMYGTKIVIGTDNLFSWEIDCYYTVYATRKDVPPLKTVE